MAVITRDLSTAMIVRAETTINGCRVDTGIVDFHHGDCVLGVIQRLDGTRVVTTSVPETDRGIV